MKTQKKYSIYIGLLKSDMKTALKPEMVLKTITAEFNQIGVIGYNTETLKGVWNGKKEPCLKVSFINTFGIKTKTILNVLDRLRTKLEQESILIEQENTQYAFII